MAILFCSVLYFLWISYAHGLYATPTASAYTYPSSTPAVATHYQSVVRSLDGNSVLSSYGKTVDTPHSSVRKYDSRVSNDALLYSHYPTVPPYSQYPAYHKAVPYVNLPYHYNTPAYYTHSSYPAAPFYHSPVYTTPQHAAPAHYIHPYLKPAPIHTGALPYSDAPSVSHISFEGFGTQYGW